MAGLTADDAESEEVGEGGAAIGGGIRGAAICSACTGPGAASGSATFITAPRRLREEHATVSEAAEGQEGSDGERKESEGRGRYSEACACVPRDRANTKRTDAMSMSWLCFARSLGLASQ